MNDNDEGDNMTHETSVEGGVTYSTDPALIDALVAQHSQCAIVDYQSLTAFCYSCGIGARWIG